MMYTPPYFQRQVYAAVLAACFITTAVGCTQNRGESAKESAMPVNEPTISAQDIMGKWVHSHEEDPKDASLREVYRPSDWNFGPSRGRRGFDLQEGNRASILGIAPADGSIEAEASWSLEPGNVLVIREQGGAVRRMHVEEVGPGRLVLRELLGSN
jgi:hypothetical protein